MRYSAGVIGEAYGLDTRNDASIIRGLSPVQFLAGMRNFYSYAPFARTAVDTLNRVEVLRGPSSVLYGQATNGDIINSVSKTQQFTPDGYVRLDNGPLYCKQTAVGPTGPLNGSSTPSGQSMAVEGVPD